MDSRCVYTLGASVIKPASEEKDLGVSVHESLKSSCQCIEAVKSANKTGLISRTFVYKNNVTMLQLYKSLVRPKLEYCIQAWRPYLCKDIELLEKAQRRATRLMFSDKSLGYYDRLRKLGLQLWRRGDFVVILLKFFF